MPSHLGADYWRKSCLEFLKLLRPGGSLFFDYLSAESTIEQPKNKTMFNSEEIMETYRSIGFSNIEILHPEKKNGSVLLTK
jgi:hypothetical protein